MKKLIILIFMFVLVVGCTESAVVQSPAINSPEVFRTFEWDTPVPMPQYNDKSLIDLVDGSTDVVSGSFVGYVGNENSNEFMLEFVVDEVVKGATAENETILVHNDILLWSDNVCTAYNYVVGNKYLIVARRSDSVYLDHILMTPVTDLFLPITDNIGAYMRKLPLNMDIIEKMSSSTASVFDVYTESDLNPENAINDTQDVVEYIKERASSKNFNEVSIRNPEYTTSTDIDTIVEQSQFVLLVTPTQSEIVSEWRGTETFRCTVNAIYKGSSHGVPESIFLPFFIDQVTIGEKYVVLINRVDGEDSTSLVFGLSSKSSVFSESDDDIQNVYAALGIA